MGVGVLEGLEEGVNCGHCGSLSRNNLVSSLVESINYCNNDTHIHADTILRSIYLE